MERQRVANESVGTLDAVAVAVDGTDANAQVFQIRDGVLSDRQSFYLENVAEAPQGVVATEFINQYYADQMAVPPQVIVQPGIEDGDELAAALGARRGARVEVRTAERGDKRRILELAERNARLALDGEKLKAERRRQQRVEALDGLQEALGLDALPLRIECFDISNLMGTHTTASMVVFEGGAPKKTDYRRFNVRGTEEGVPDDFAAMEEVLGRRLAQWEAQQDLSPHDPKRNESFATLPNLIVIDGGPGPALGRRARAARVPRPRRGGRLAGQAHRGGLRAGPPRSRSGCRTTPPELQLLQRVRDEAHRFAITHHRTRRDKAMTSSVLDDLPGIGPSRKRALLAHFGSPEAILAASREQLEGVPGLPGRTRAAGVRAPAPHERVTSVADARIPAVPDAELEDLVVLTGVSGAGKSTAMAVFEDAGYFCVDNLPPEMIASLVELFVHEGSKVERAAVATDARGGDFFGALRAVLEELAGLGVHHRLVFLDCDDREILTRFQETRRRHPVAVGSSVELGIATERALRGAPARAADAVIDSTGLKPHMLRRKIADELLRGSRAARLAVSFESFGFKHGPAPRDADLVFDVRFLPNPHYEPEPPPADRARAGRRRVHRPRRRAGGLLRAARAAAGLPAAALRRRGQVPPDGRRSAARAGATARSPSPSTSRAATRERDDAFVEVAHRDLGRG